MNLSSPAPRRALHARRIEFDGFEREDGLFDIEAHIVDTKHFSFDHRNRGSIQAGTPIHDMRLRLTVDDQRVVRAIEVGTFAAPYADCSTVAPSFQALVGKSVARGWRHSVNEALSGALGCTHLRELLLAMGTVVFQTMEGGQRGVNKAIKAVDDDVEPFFLNRCRAWSQSGELVKELLPRFYIKQID